MNKLNKLSNHDLKDIYGGKKSSGQCAASLFFSGVLAFGDPVAGLSTAVYSYLSNCR